MGGGGKGGTTTSTQTVQIPPEVLARYNAVNARAEQVAQQPFQPYGGEFVAPLTPTQTAGIQATNAASGQAQPYYGAATQGLLGAQQGGAGYINAATQAALAGGAPITPASLQTQQYMNPYTRSVVGATQAALGQQFGQQQAQQQAEAIRAGAYGGDRAGLQRQALRGQQGLAAAQAIAPLYQQGYQQAQQTELQVAQANRAALQGLGTQLAGLGQQGYTMGAGTAQQLAGLGTGAQQAALQGAQAQLAAGQIQQQTQQAQDTAQYQQFLQERGYPFQVAQFLANIAMGTGALSGSTTSGTTTQPGGFFSDKRLKEDVKEIGETHDGQPIYSYKYKGDDRTQIGLMAQDVEKKHPEAVGLMGGYKTVDYKKATENAERSHKDMGGGLMPDDFDYNSMGGAVTSDMAGEGFERGGYVGGGLVGNDDWAQIIAANKQALGVYGGQQPMGGGSPGATGIVPAANIPVPKPIEAAKLTMPAQRPAGLSTAMQTGKDIASTYKGGKEALLGSAADKSAGLIGGGGSTSGKSVFGELKDWWDKAEGGLVVHRHAYADGGSDESQAEEAIPYDPSDVMHSKDPMEGVLKAGSQKPQQLKAAQMSMSGSGGGGGGGLLGGIKDVAGGIGALKTIGEAGSWLGNTALPFLFAADGGRINPYAYGGLVPRQGYATRGATDAPADYSPEADMPSPRAQEAGLVVDRPDREKIIRTFLPINEQMESSGNPNARNPASSASGLFQFTKPTWAGLVAKYPDRGWTEADIMNPQAQREMAPLHANDLLNSFQKFGIDPSHQALRLGWAFGEAGGPAFMKNVLANPDAPGVSFASRAAIQANPTWFFNKDGSAKTASETMNTVLGKFGSGTRETPVPPNLVGAAPSGGGEKKSIGDVVTSEGFLVPALGFLGSMLASNRPNLGQALGEGIMGGVGAYQAQRKMAAELPKIEAQTELEKANVGRVNMMTRSLRAGMLTPTWQPGVGLVVIDKENPYAGMIPVTDADGKPLPGHEKLVEEMQKSGAVPAGIAGAQPSAKPAPVAAKASDITKIIEKPMDANSWTPTTSVPKNYIPANQANITMRDPSTGKMTESAQAALDTGKTTVAGLEQQALKTGPAMVQLQQIIQEYNSLPQSGFLTPGAGATRRNELIANANAALRAIGAQPIDPNAAGSAEAIQKGTFNLGAGVANSMGTREPGYIVQQAVKNSPGIEMSKKGFDLVSSGLTQNAEYANDRAKFFRDYLSKFQHLDGAQEAFDHANPPQMYADRAMLNTIPEADRQYLRNYVAQNPSKKADAMRRFEFGTKDQPGHGKGTARIVLGQ